MAMDAKNVQTILHYFSERKPFSKDSRELRSLSSGVVADTSVDVDKAESLGQSHLQSVYGKSVAEYTFRKKDQVTTLVSSTYITVEGERLEIDPKQFDSSLLQRLPDKASLQAASWCMSLMVAHSCKDRRGPARQHVPTYPICMYNMYFNHAVVVAI